MSRIGVFICHCGINIAGSVDVEQAAQVMGEYDNTVVAKEYKYMCSEPGQALIRNSITEHDLDGVVVSACSPGMHEKTFREAVASVGLNPYRCEIANIREQCAWVHQNDREEATSKAVEIIRTMVEKVGRDEELTPLHLPLTKKAIVIGGGAAGLGAALDIADAGYPVVLVEREESLGGKMSQLSGTFLNFEDAADLLQEMIDQAQDHPNIQVVLGAQVVDLEGYVGNFGAEVEKLADSSRHTYEVGAVVVATGWDPYPLDRLPEYGGGGLPDVIDGLTFEQMLKPGAEIRRPSDGRVPKELVFVQCAGSRDPERGVSYCSKVCCMYTAKQAMMFKERVPDGQAYVFYIDIRSMGKGYDEFVQGAMEEHDVLYLRGKVSKVFGRGEKVVVWGADTLAGQQVEVEADMVVLATPMLPSTSAVPLARTLHIQTNEYGFYNEAHPKLRPVESLTAGVFLAGVGQGPKDIPETMAQAGGAAAKVLRLFAQPEMIQEPTVAYVIEELCSACGACVAVCPYGAREIDPMRGFAAVNAALCQTCGACVVACPNKASRVHNWEPGQVLAMADALLERSER